MFYDPTVMKSMLNSHSNFADLFGKAKKKILKQDDQVQSLSPVSPGQKNVPDSSWPEQEIGRCLLFLIHFEKLRRVRNLICDFQG